MPKAELVSKLQALMHAGDLRIAASLPDAAVLAQELADFQVKYIDAGNATFSTREGAHDDLVRSQRRASWSILRPNWPTGGWSSRTRNSEPRRSPSTRSCRRLSSGMTATCFSTSKGWPKHCPAYRIAISEPCTWTTNWIGAGQTKLFAIRGVGCWPPRRGAANPLLKLCSGSAL